MSTWILLRGLARESRHWGDFPARLREAFPDEAVLAVDLPGCGTQTAVRAQGSIEAIADACRFQAYAAGARPPFRLLAISLGGMVSIGWARAHPEEIDGCVLINTSLGSFNPFFHRLRPSAWPSLIRLLAAPRGRDKERIVLHLTSARRDESTPILDDWIVIRNSRPVSLATATRQLVAAARFRPRARPPAPILVLASRGDRLVNPACSRRIAQVWQTDYAEHPSAGHDLPLDDGPWIIERLRRWTARHAAERGKLSGGGTPPATAVPVMPHGM